MRATQLGSAVGWPELGVGPGAAEHPAVELVEPDRGDPLGVRHVVHGHRPDAYLAHPPQPTARSGAQCQACRHDGTCARSVSRRSCSSSTRSQVSWRAPPARSSTGTASGTTTVSATSQQTTREVRPRRTSRASSCGTWSRPTPIRRQTSPRSRTTCVCRGGRRRTRQRVRGSRWPRWPRRRWADPTPRSVRTLATSASSTSSATPDAAPGLSACTCTSTSPTRRKGYGSSTGSGPGCPSCWPSRRTRRTPPGGTPATRHGGTRSGHAGPRRGRLSPSGPSASTDGSARP